jgi:LEA14-like dessication related protein
MRSQTSRLLQIGLALIAAIILTGCASLETFQKPRIQVIETRLASFDRESLQLTVVLEVDNPNSSEISLTDVKAKLFLADTEIADASTTQKQIRLPANSSVLVPLRIDATYKTLPIALQRSIIALIYGSLPYRISGSLVTNNGLLTVPFEKSGEIAQKR